MTNPKTITAKIVVPEWAKATGEDGAPYWLCYMVAQYIEDIGKSCERETAGGELCHNTSDCLTEWCAPCAAKAWLDEQKRLSAPPRNWRKTLRRVK